MVFDGFRIRVRHDPEVDLPELLGSMTTIYIVQHVRTRCAEEDVKFIGAYSTKELALAAVHRLSTRPGFSSSIDGFPLIPTRLRWTTGRMGS